MVKSSWEACLRCFLDLHFPIKMNPSSHYVITLFSKIRSDIVYETVLLLLVFVVAAGDIVVPIGPTPSNIINRSVFGL